MTFKIEKGRCLGDLYIESCIYNTEKRLIQITKPTAQLSLEYN